jgi:SNF2 family DNA or RNA helicase
MDFGTRRAYAELKKDFATDVDEHEILAWSQGAKNVLLDKMTTSPWLLHKEGEPHGGKFETLREDLQNRSEPTLVFAHYRDSVEAATRVASSLGLKAGYIHGGTSDKANASLVRDFKRGRVDVLVGSLETLSEGLTLTIADTAIFLERSYKPSRNTQATYRVYRLGQEKAVQIRRYITPKSVDSGKERLLAEKNDHQCRHLSAADFLRIA